MEDRTLAPGPAGPTTEAAGPVARWLSTAQPEALFVLSAIAQYVGAVIAVGLFDRVEPQTVAWFRVMGAAVALLGVSHAVGGSDGPVSQLVGVAVVRGRDRR